MTLALGRLRSREQTCLSFVQFWGEGRDHVPYEGHEVSVLFRCHRAYVVCLLAPMMTVQYAKDRMVMCLVRPGDIADFPAF